MPYQEVSVFFLTLSDMACDRVVQTYFSETIAVNPVPNIFEHESTELPITLLKPDPDNPRKRDKRSLREIAKSIKEFGFVQPIVADEKYNIIIGHGRYAAAKYLGYKTVPVIIAKGLTEQQRKRLQIADNRLSIPVLANDIRIW